jgi:malonyl-CoA O-methyltransferase
MLRWPFARRRNAVAESVDPQAAYAMWAPTYPPHPHNQLMEIEQQTVLSLLPDLTGMTVLDAGCGTGRYLHRLRALGAKPIGLDLSAAMLARARDVTPRIARANICALPIDSMSVDVILCGLALGDVAHLELALAEMARVLRPGGCVVYSVVHPDGADAGWSRTFDAGGRQVAINSYWHSLDEHRQACRAAGLRVTAWQEPVLREAPDLPAVLVVRASR